MKITKYLIVTVHLDDEMLGAEGKMFNLSFSGALYNDSKNKRRINIDSASISLKSGEIRLRNEYLFPLNYSIQEI